MNLVSLAKNPIPSGAVVNTFGGYKVQGRGAGADQILRDAKAVSNAGAFSVVLEKVTEPLARTTTESISIPTIGIGASAACDGQILVIDDVLGIFTDFRPKFVKRYAELGALATEAFAAYVGEVRGSAFPTEAHSFGTVPPARRSTRKLAS